MPSASNFLSEAEKDRIVSEIRDAEAGTTGEIRIHLENHCRGDAMKRAIAIFHQLKMDQTKFRNGLLIYIAVKDHQFAIIGDEALDQKTTPDYWHGLSAHLHDRFAEGLFADGITELIRDAGKVLAHHFPNLENYQKNELPDDISFD